MKKSEQVIYITLIDFLLQLLFLGLVLWVIFGLNKPGLSDEAINKVGGIDNAAASLKLVTDLMQDNGIQNPAELAEKVHAIIDPVGGIQPTLELIGKIQDLMRKTGIQDPQELADKIRALIDTAGNLNKISSLSVRVQDLMRKANINNPDQFLTWMGQFIDMAKAFKGADNLNQFLASLRQLMQTSGEQNPDKLLAALNAISQQSGAMDLDTLLRKLQILNQTDNLEQTLQYAKLGKQIAEQAQTSDAAQITAWIEKGRKTTDDTGGNDAPPYIELGSATKDFSFASGSAKLSVEFQTKLTNQVVRDIQAHINKYHINLIEVIGHTDSVPSKSGTRQMDEKVESIAAKSFTEMHLPEPVQGSNTDLGMLRALEVVKLLKHLSRQGKLTGIDPDTGFRAYSSGQLTMPDGRLANGEEKTENASRRRIEIRLTRLGDKIQAK